MRVIEQFMWGYQALFRRDLEMAAEVSLVSVGLTVAPVALLIGFAEDPGGHPICVEPEGIGILPGVFADCAANGDAAYERHASRRMINTDRGLHDQFQAGVLDKCRAAALGEALNAQIDHGLKRWFVGHSARVGRYRVYPVIGVLQNRWDALPTLAHRDHDHRNEMHLSLQEAVVRELLQNASFALSTSDQPQGIRRNDRDEVVRRALNAFVRALVFFKGDFMGGDLVSSLNAVAAQPYEGRTGVGTMLLGRETDYSLELKFESPIRLSQTRALRKALEMTDPGLHLVTTGKAALGLGRLKDDYVPEREAAFFLRVIGRGSWELEHAGVPLLVVADGHAAVPRERLGRSKFEDAAERLFGDDRDVERLWDLAIAASRQAHGTMLVVHVDAAAEAIRLSPPAMRVEPCPLTDSTLLAVSAIDGAIIVNPGGECHAVGVILDGRAALGLGDASRGARFNSAQRYLAETRGSCLIIIVSEDGMLNLIPDLPRRLRASYVEKLLTDVESLSRSEPVDFEAFFKREEHLRSLAFYLNHEQCERANSSRERVERYRESSFVPHGGLGGITRVGYALLEPDSRLDNSFFLDEDQ